MNILDSNFPKDIFPKIRPHQADLINQLKKTSRRFVIIQAPVATGKSAVAITLLNSHQSGYILTPRKFLQDQYAQDFPQIPMLKGKSNYGCDTYNQGKHEKFHQSCNECVLIPHARSDFIKYMLDELYDTENDYQVPSTCCPYYKNLRRVMDAPRIICNFHALWFNSLDMNRPRLARREILIIDEAHELETIIRDLSKYNVLTYALPNNPNDMNATQWIYFLQPYVKQIAEEDFPKLISGENNMNDGEISRYIDEDTKEPSVEKYVNAKLDELNKLVHFEENGGFVAHTYQEDLTRHGINFIPLNIAPQAHRLFDLADNIVLMSGTIFDVEQFALPLGLTQDDIDVVSVSSPIPAQYRPVMCYQSKMVNAQYKNWKTNFPQLIQSIMEIITTPKLQNVKGVIHTTSYEMSKEIAKGLEEESKGLLFDRIMFHYSKDFDKKLQKFMESEKNEIFITPVCSQGIDFKDDLAKFQMIVRLPYPNVGDKYHSYQYENNPDWINYQALMTFGQQLGRINRHEYDKAITYLLDSRFIYFIRKNYNKIPQYIHESIYYKD